jgi:hypothetical protein
MMIERLTEYNPGCDVIVNAVELASLEEDYKELESVIDMYRTETALLKTRYKDELRIYEETLNAKLES